MMETILKELQNEYDFTNSQLEGIKIAMASYAQDAVMDSAVCEEAEEIMRDYSNAIDKRF